MSPPREDEAMTVEEARKIALEILGYPEDLLKDYSVIYKIENALLSFGQKEYERGVRESAGIAFPIDSQGLSWREQILKLLEQKGE